MLTPWFAITLGALAQMAAAPANDRPLPYDNPSAFALKLPSLEPDGARPVENLEAAEPSIHDLPNLSQPAHIARPGDLADVPDDEQLPFAPFASTGWLLTASWLSPRGVDGFGSTDVSVAHGWAWQGPFAEQPLSVAPGFGMHFLNGPADLELPGVVYDVFLDLSWRVWDRERGGISVGVTPGLYGDYRVISDESFQVTGWILGDLRLGPHWSLSGGVAVVRQLESSWLPIGGVTWTPTDDWQLEFTIPRPRIARRLFQTEDRDFWCFVAGQYGGGSWTVADGVGGNLLLSYSDMRILVGLNTWHVSNREWTWQIGYVFSRDIAVDRYSIASPADSWVLQVVASF